MKLNNFLPIIIIVIAFSINFNLFSGGFPDPCSNKNRVKKLLQKVNNNTQPKLSSHEKDNKALIERFKKAPNINFQNLIGKIPNYIRVLVNAAKNSDGANISQNILFHGPPGTGKTALAESIAGETARNFYSVPSSSIVSVYQASGAKTIASLFEDIINSKNPSVLFIDELDLISDREAKNGSNESNGALYELHAQLNNKIPLIFIAATNNLGKITSALENRFDKTIEIPLPTQSKIKELLNYYAIKFKLNIKDKKNIFNSISSELKGFSCRDIENLSKQLNLLKNQCFSEEKGKEKELNGKTITEDDYKIVIYTSQTKKLPQFFDIALLFQYYLNDIGAKINPEDKLDNLFSEIEGYFSHKDIEKAIDIANDFAQENEQETISLMDFYAGVYYDQKIKFANVETRIKLLEYFCSNQNIVFEDSVIKNKLLEIIATYADDNFTGEELNNIIKNAYIIAKKREFLAKPIISSEDMYIGLYEELKKKADKIKFAFRKNTDKWKSPNNASRTFITDYITNLLPDEEARKMLITYFLRKYAHKLTEKEITEFIKQSDGLSWYSIEKCINFAYDYAFAESIKYINYNSLKLACEKYNITLETDPNSSCCLS